MPLHRSPAAHPGPGPHPLAAGPATTGTSARPRLPSPCGGPHRPATPAATVPFASRPHGYRPGTLSREAPHAHRQARSTRRDRLALHRPRHTEALRLVRRPWPRGHRGDDDLAGTSTRRAATPSPQGSRRLPGAPWWLPDWPPLLAAAGLIGTMATAIRKVHWANGPWAANGGYEYNLVLIAALTALVETGPGDLSLDALLGRKLSGPAWALAALAAGAASSAAVIALGSRSAPGRARGSGHDAVPGHRRGPGHLGLRATGRPARRDSPTAGPAVDEHTGRPRRGRRRPVSRSPGGEHQLRSGAGRLLGVDVERVRGGALDRQGELPAHRGLQSRRRQRNRVGGGGRAPGRHRAEDSRAQRRLVGVRHPRLRPGGVRDAVDVLGAGRPRGAAGRRGHLQ